MLPCNRPATTSAEKNYYCSFGAMLFFICDDNLHTCDPQIQPILRSIYVINSSQKSFFGSFALLILCPFSYHVVPLEIEQVFYACLHHIKTCGWIWFACIRTRKTGNHIYSQTCQRGHSIKQSPIL